MRVPKSGKKRIRRFGRRSRWGRTMVFVPKHGNDHMAMVPGIMNGWGEEDYDGRIDWLHTMGRNANVNNRSWYIGMDETHTMD